jgi:hypothetical protein
MCSIKLVNDCYITGLKTLGAFFNGEFNLLAFFEVAISIALDCREMDKYIFSTFAGNETLTFGSVEPFDRADNTF